MSCQLQIVQTLDISTAHCEITIVISGMTNSLPENFVNVLENLRGLTSRRNVLPPPNGDFGVQ